MLFRSPKRGFTACWAVFGGTDGSPAWRKKWHVAAWIVPCAPADSLVLSAKFPRQTEKRDSFNRRIVIVKAARFAIIVSNETSRFFRAGSLVDTVTVLVSRQIPVGVAVVLFVFPMNVEMGVNMGVLVGVDQAAVTVFMGMEMGMDVGVLKFNAVSGHEPGAGGHDDQGNIKPCARPLA